MAAGILTLAAGAVEAAVPEAARDDLERLRPTLVYSRHERDRTTAVDAIVPRLDGHRSVDLSGIRRGREVVYGHRARDAAGRTGSSTGSSS